MSPYTLTRRKSEDQQKGFEPGQTKAWESMNKLKTRPSGFVYLNTQKNRGSAKRFEPGQPARTAQADLPRYRLA